MKIEDIGELEKAFKAVAVHTMSKLGSLASGEVKDQMPMSEPRKIDGVVFEKLADIMGSIFSQPESEVFGPIQGAQQAEGAISWGMERDITIPDAPKLRASYDSDEGLFTFGLNIVADDGSPQQKLNDFLGDYDRDPLNLVHLNTLEEFGTDYVIGGIETFDEVMARALEADVS